MNEYQFNQVAKRMSNRYGHISHGDEMQHNMTLTPIELNAMKAHREDPSINGYRMIEGIMLVLHEIERRLGINDNDVSRFENEGNLKIKHALLMAFDPFENEKIKIITKNIDWSNLDNLRDYYAEPIRCLIRIKESAEKWTKHYGQEGYFTFLEGTLSELYPDDNEYVFAIAIS